MPVRAQAAAPPTSQPTSISVAVLTFDASLPGSPEMGKQIADTLNATLSAVDGITLVDRSELGKVVAENALSLTGLVDADKAVRVGKLVGAKLLVTGRAFVLGKQLFVTAKIIGTETGLVDGVLVKGAEDTDIGVLVASLTDKIAGRITKDGGRLIASNDALADPIPSLKAELAKLKKPNISISVSEQHIAAVQAIDPAAETELRFILTDAGFTVIDPDKVPSDEIPLNITGEAFSEAGPTIGRLCTSSARVEIKLINHSDGKIVFTGRSTMRAVDLSEAIAGKAAIQKAAHAVAIDILRYFATTLPAAPSTK
jgi:TolB-like protein